MAKINGIKFKLIIDFAVKPTFLSVTTPENITCESGNTFNCLTMTMTSQLNPS
jgi:hypothetical protein